MEDWSASKYAALEGIQQFFSEAKKSDRGNWQVRWMKRFADKLFFATRGPAWIEGVKGIIHSYDSESVPVTEYEGTEFVPTYPCVADLDGRYLIVPDRRDRRLVARDKEGNWTEHNIPIPSGFDEFHPYTTRFWNDKVYIAGRAKGPSGNGLAVGCTKTDSADFDTFIDTNIGGSYAVEPCNMAFYGNSLWIPSDGGGDIVVWEFDGSTLTQHTLVSGVGAKETQVLSDSDYLYVWNASYGWLWRYDGSSWTSVVRTRFQENLHGESEGDVSVISQSEHQDRARGWYISNGNRIYRFEPPGRVKPVIEFTQPVRGIEFWNEGLFAGSEEGGTEGMDDEIPYGVGLYRAGMMRAWTYYINPSTLTREEKNPLQDTVKPWDSSSISAGDTTEPVSVWGNEQVTIMFVSDTAGTLTINGDAYGETLRQYDTVSINANSPEFYILSGNLSRIQLGFDSAATVTAEIDKR